ncbi:hypothetical protein MWU49_00765 [Alcanivorax sp. S6407]|uniref:hypothetical protein n=1 Tax=Alcanivorax sp. S6407 TaxID=2926424 RepID=UPI001FF22698|nr:hypothetical protein [Alcanivorax sp. S6407]MCK0152223.1 hypothetical protein [Alcanivorax sp. S6407]
MSKPKFIGLAKFFRDESFLDLLIDGVFYCNAPETYRLDGSEGIGDLNESCMHSYRADRGDKPVVLKIDGKEIEGVTALTTHINKLKDMWLHCWFALDFPENDEQLLALTEDLKRVRSEFGENFAFLPGVHLGEFTDRVRSLQDGPFERGRVLYSQNRENWSVGCKAEAYAYQREYRFGLGQCKHTSTEPLKLKYENGFGDLLQKNPHIKISDKESGAVWFKLSKGECYCRPES